MDADRNRSPWYRDGSYRNLDDKLVPAPGSLGRMWRWKTSRRAPPELVESADTPPSPLAGERARLARPTDGLQLAWLGHASVLIQIDGAVVLTDPIFGNIARVAVRRLSEPPIGVDDLPRIDVIAVSHNHYDHLDVPSLRALRRRFPEALMLVPSGLGTWLRKRVGEPVRSLEWWGRVEVRGVGIESVPAQHWSTRGLGDRFQTHWCGWLVRGRSGSAYMAGDTGFGVHFEAIAERHGPIDVAALPVGGYSPRWFMADQHIGPDEAVRAARILGARTLLPIHWGTYRLTDEPLDEPARLVRREAERARQPLALVRPGGVYSRSAIAGEWSPRS